MKYDDFLTQIYLRHSSNVKLGLDRMYQILENMNNPEQHLQGIHIAGTNGKGSTSAMSEAILLAHGHTTGMNTSPHLIDYTERFRINGEIITSDELMTLYHKYQPCFDQTEASFFEITTALAFKLFVDKYINYDTVTGFILYLVLILFFAYFYTFMQLNPEELSSNLGKNGGYIPGIKPGKQTSGYIKTVLSRLTIIGGVFLMLIAGLPIIFSNLSKLPSNIIIGGTGLLIVVGVALETYNQIESQLISLDFNKRSYR